MRYLVFLIAPLFAFAFPNHSFEGMGSLPSDKPVVEGCIGDCASCHSLLPYEAKEILEKKFDIKEVVSIAVKRGYFEIVYKDSKGKEHKINLLFSKDKACKDLILLDK